MADFIFKMRVLWLELSHAFQGWRDSVWQHDLDEPYCCDGGTHHWGYCGCGGQSIRDVYTPAATKQDSSG